MANATESSLMRRTKKELVEIILRKDAVEISKNGEIKNANESIEDLRKINKGLTDRNEKLTIDNRNLKDSAYKKDKMFESYKETKEKEINKLNKDVKVWKIVTIVVSICTLIVLSV